jgi:F0F1-type ATP synthase epsilon subunit
MEDTPTQASQPTPVQTEPAKPEPTQAHADRVHVVIRNRQTILYEGDVKAISSKNDTGIFDVLPEHTNFISLINESITVHLLDGSEQTFQLQNGVMKVKEYAVHCYIDLLSSDEIGAK